MLLLIRIGDGFVADHYGSRPSTGPGIREMIDEGLWVFSSPKPEAPADTDKGTPARPAFAPDSCHPFAETGHKLYTEAIARSFESMEGQGIAGSYSVPAPFTPDNHEGARLIPLTEAMLGEGWLKLDPQNDSIARNFSNRLSTLWARGEGRTSVTFAFHGCAAAVYDLLGPDGGELEVIVDGQPADRETIRRLLHVSSPGHDVLLSSKEARDHTVTVD